MVCMPNEPESGQLVCLLASAPSLVVYSVGHAPEVPKKLEQFRNVSAVPIFHGHLATVVVKAGAEKRTTSI